MFASMSDSTANTGRARFQFTLRTLLIATTAIATLIAGLVFVWRAMDPFAGHPFDQAIWLAHTSHEGSNPRAAMVAHLRAVPRAVSGVYAAEASDMTAFEEVRRLCAEFLRREGRRPRILVAKMGQDGTTAAPR